MQRKNPAKAKEQVTVRGVVAPTEWDMRDEVVAVTLYAHDDLEYIVNNRAMVRRLMKFMDEEVEAHGVLSEDDYGNEVLDVSDFAPVEAEAEDDEEEGFADLEDEELVDEDWDEEDGDDEEEDGNEEDWDDGEDGGRKRRRAR